MHHRRQTEFSLKHLIMFKTPFSKKNTTVTSFEIPTIELVAKEIGVIFTTTRENKEKIEAEEQLVELLQHQSSDVRKTAYFFIFASSAVSSETPQALHDFEGKSCNKEIIKEVQAII